MGEDEFPTLPGTRAGCKRQIAHNRQSQIKMGNLMGGPIPPDIRDDNDKSGLSPSMSL